MYPLDNDLGKLIRESIINDYNRKHTTLNDLINDFNSKKR